MLDIVTFDASSFYDKDYSGSYFDEYDRKKKIDIKKIYTGEEFFNLSVSKGAYRVVVMIYFYSRDFLNKNNIFFVEGITLEDNLYVFETLLKAKSIKYISKDFYYRRIRKNSIMTSKRDFYNDIELLKYIVKEEYRIYKECKFNNKLTRESINYVIRDNYYIMFRKLEENIMDKEKKVEIINQIKIILKDMKSILNKDLKLLVYNPTLYKIKFKIKELIKRSISC